MRRKLILVPVGWPCTQTECPPGLFVFVGKPPEAAPSVGVQTDYHDVGPFLSNGDKAGMHTASDLVQPVEAKWEEIDE